MAEKFRLIAEFEGRSLQVTDPVTLAACARYLRALADAASALLTNDAAPLKRGPGRLKSVVSVTDSNDGTGETPPAAAQ
jgi:hypothetical protein